LTAGPHHIGVTFPRKFSSLLETKRQPPDARFNRHRHPRRTPAVYELSIAGPFQPRGPGETPSRRRIFGSSPEDAGRKHGTAQAELDAARTILTELARRAYRRPVDEADLKTPLEFFRREREDGGFEAGIQSALAVILVNPNFLFRIEQDPPETPAGTAYRVSDLELASRLSFFLWSSIPDDRLLELAEAGRLSEPAVLREQVQRMLRDPRSRSLVDSFASQWLYLRNLESITPDLRRFPDFDENLRRAFRRETELLFGSVLKDDRSVLELISSDHTYLNERLAEHYGIPHVLGSHFRRVDLPAGSDRGGILRHGSILMVTSYATRTSPTVRGNWVLENILGTPPPPPPPNVPSLDKDSAQEPRTVRERLARHRADPACASCHRLMDPVGFALENYDAVGRWRTLQRGVPVDSSGGLPDGTKVSGVGELEAAILRRPDVFVGTLVEKLLTFALGRGIEPTDGPAVRRVVREASRNDYRFSSLVTGIVQSQPFQMRTAQ
jgi:hypothetical protein